MSLLSSLTAFGLRQVLGDGVENVVDAVQQRFRDHSQTLPKALERAQDRAWQSLGVSLAGDGFIDRVKVFFANGDDKGVRDQVQAFLKANTLSFDDATVNFREACLEELKKLRKSGLLSRKGMPEEEVARQAAGFRRYVDSQGMIEGACQAVGNVARALASNYPNLAELLQRPTASGVPLLAAAFCYFFRREVETDDELANGLLFDGLRQLTASQNKAFGEVGKAIAFLGGRFDVILAELGRIEATTTATHGAVLDIQAELRHLANLHLSNSGEVRSLHVQVLDQLARLNMQRGEVKPHDSFSIRGESERLAVKALLTRFRQLPIEEQHTLPALLNGLGKLQVGAGDFKEAGRTFGEVVAVVAESPGKAEASYNAYRAALEARAWDVALEAVHQAALLDPARYLLFPLHRYEPKRILGAGGFGTAFLCHDRNFDEAVVVKTLHNGEVDRGIDDLFREARTLRRLSHPAIIGVRDCEYADHARKDRPYLVMDYFPGFTLEHYVEKQNPLLPEHLLSIALQVAQAMYAAHGQNVLHRDIKPANILIRQEGDEWLVKIIDFGLALRKRTLDTSLAQAVGNETILSQSVAGTLQYAPPEQLGRMPGVKTGHYSDVYAFGKTCCYALFRTTEPKRRQWGTIPEELADLLEKCIEQELDMRFPDFGPVMVSLKAMRVARHSVEVVEQRERDQRRSEQEAEPQRRQQETAEAEVPSKLRETEEQRLRESEEAARKEAEDRDQERHDQEEANRRQEQAEADERRRQREAEEQSHIQADNAEAETGDDGNDETDDASTLDLVEILDRAAAALDKRDFYHMAELLHTYRNRRLDKEPVSRGSDNRYRELVVRLKEDRDDDYEEEYEADKAEEENEESQDEDNEDYEDDEDIDGTEGDDDEDEEEEDEEDDEDDEDFDGAEADERQRQRETEEQRHVDGCYCDSCWAKRSERQRQEEAGGRVEQERQRREREHVENQRREAERKRDEEVKWARLGQASANYTQDKPIPVDAYTASVLCWQHDDSDERVSKLSEQQTERQRQEEATRQVEQERQRREQEAEQQRRQRDPDDCSISLVELLDYAAAALVGIQLNRMDDLLHSYRKRRNRKERAPKGLDERYRELVDKLELARHRQQR